jgi:hypothetical protein
MIPRIFQKLHGHDPVCQHPLLIAIDHQTDVDVTVVSFGSFERTPELMPEPAKRRNLVSRGLSDGLPVLFVNAHAR